MGERQWTSIFVDCANFVRSWFSKLNEREKNTWSSFWIWTTTQVPAQWAVWFAVSWKAVLMSRTLALWLEFPIPGTRGTWQCWFRFSQSYSTVKLQFSARVETWWAENRKKVLLGKAPPLWVRVIRLSEVMLRWDCRCANLMAWFIGILCFVPSALMKWFQLGILRGCREVPQVSFHCCRKQVCSVLPSP